MNGGTDSLRLIKFKTRFSVVSPDIGAARCLSFGVFITTNKKDEGGSRSLSDSFCRHFTQRYDFLLLCSIVNEVDGEVVNCFSLQHWGSRAIQNNARNRSNRPILFQFGP